jgi:hypothetical protein
MGVASFEFKTQGQQVDTKHQIGTKVMGRRKGKRKNHKPQRHQTVEVLEAGPLRFERQGRFIRMQNQLPADKLNEVREALARERDGIPAQIHALANEISDLIQPFNSFDVLAWFGFFHMAQDPETYRESSHKGVAADVEYLNMMVLRGPYREGTIAYPEPSRVTAIQERLTKIREMAMQFHATLDLGREAADQDQEREIVHLRMQQKLHELMVRVPAYPHHAEEVLRGLFDPFAGELVDAIGFSCVDALAIIRAISNHIQVSLTERLRRASIAARDIESAVRKMKRGQETPEYSRDMLADLSRLPKRDVSRASAVMSSTWALRGLGRAEAMTIEECAEVSGVPAARCERFFDRFAARFGDVSTDWSLPEPVSTVRSKPLVIHDRAVFCALPGSVEWALQGTFEDALRTAHGLNPRYEQHRHDFTLSTALKLLNRAMPGCRFESHLNYDVHEGGNPVRAELDALGSFDTWRFYVEVKGKSLSAPALGGQRRRLSTTLEELVSDPHKQGLRALDYVCGRPTTTFMQGGRTIEASSEGVTENVLIAVTLAPIGHLTSILNGQSAFLASGQKLAWTVSLFDLMVICDLVDPGAFLPLYVLRRLRSAGQGLIEASDELDFFGHYLHDGLYLEGPEDIGSAQVLRLLSFTDSFDQYYHHQLGIRQKKAPRPRMAMTWQYEQLLNAIVESKLEGYVDAAVALLDMSGDGRKQLMSFVEKVRARARKDGRDHDCSVYGSGDGGWGFTYVIAKADEESERQYRQYCQRKAKEHRAHRWVTIVQTPGPGGRIWMIERAHGGPS